MAARPMDTETRAVSDDHGAIRLWLRMLATNRLVETRTRRLLQDRYETDAELQAAFDSADEVELAFTLEAA